MEILIVVGSAVVLAMLVIGFLFALWTLVTLTVEVLVFSILFFLIWNYGVVTYISGLDPITPDASFVVGMVITFVKWLWE